MKTVTYAAKKLLDSFLQMHAEAVADRPDKAKCAELAEAVAQSNAERVISDAQRVLQDQHKLMSFKEFFDSPFSTERTWCILAMADAAVVLRWNPSNYKWHMPRPNEGSEEVGHLDTVGPIRAYGSIKGRIDSVQILVPDIVMSA